MLLGLGEVPRRLWSHRRETRCGRQLGLGHRLGGPDRLRPAWGQPHGFPCAWSLSPGDAPGPDHNWMRHCDLCVSPPVVAASDKAVRAESLDMVSMLREQCRPALKGTPRRPSDGRLQDQEDVWEEEEGRKEVAAAD
jgi:hypothetical protein